MDEELAERMSDDRRIVATAHDLQHLYDSAYDNESFHAAIREGNFEAAAEYHDLSATELHAVFDQILSTVQEVGADYGDLVEY